jgi:hypothetical protein
MSDWWTADNNLIDLFGTNHLVGYNGWYYTNGEQGAAFHFDGSTGYLEPVVSPTEISPNWSLCLWVNRQNASGTSASILGDSTYAIKLEQYNGTRDIGLTHSGVADYYFKISVPQSVWTHVALVDSGSQIQLYTNGVFASSQLYSNSVAIITPSGFPLPRACIGGDLISGGLTDPMLGRLDEIQIYHSALTATQIAAIYAAGSAGLVSAPQFTASTNGNNQIQLSVEGLTGKNISLDSSPDLLNWSFLGSFSNPNGSLQVPEPATQPQLFFRASQPLP